MTDVGIWYKGLPIFTKYWLSLTVGISLLARFGLLDPNWLILITELVFKKLHLWRPVTALFFYPLNSATGFHFLLNCFFLYNYSLRLETDHFKNSPADYFFMLVFNWLCCVLIGLAVDLPMLMDPMVLSVLYVWCQLNKDVIVNFWFGTRFKAMYLPWVLLVFNLVFNGSFMSVIGVIVGNLYFYLKFKYPQDLGGPALLETPRFLKNYFPDVSGGVHTFGAPPERQRANNVPERRNLWGGGRGHVLGRD